MKFKQFLKEMPVDLSKAEKLLRDVSKSEDGLSIYDLKSVMKFIAKDWKEGTDSVDVSMLDENARMEHDNMVDIGRDLDALVKKIDKAIK